MRRDGERTYLTADEALGVMAWQDDNGCEAVHTFRGGFAIIGCDWPRRDVEEWLAKNEAQLTGPMARRMKHGVGGIDGHGLITFATDEDRLVALKREAP